MAELPGITEAPRFTLPEWEDVCKKKTRLGEESLDPIELFVYHHEPAEPYATPFRAALLNLCNELYKP